MTLRDVFALHTHGWLAFKQVLEEAFVKFYKSQLDIF